MKPWPDEVKRMCADLSDSPAVMTLLGQLAEGNTARLLEEMRDAVIIGDYSAAARREAEASSWEAMPRQITALADEWRQRSRRG